MTEKFSIVIPTYNERDNIAPLLEEISNALGDKYTYEVLFIDDNSPDKTSEVINELSSKYPARVIVRTEEKGLSTAVIHGFNNARYDTIVVMDADLQHPPVVIPRLIQAIEDGNEIAVASRYIYGGGCEGWSKFRVLTSKGATLLGHLLLPPSRRVNDIMSGYFAFKKKLLDGIVLKPIGYKILLEILTLCPKAPAKEVPFMFRLRERGESKLKANTYIEYVKHIFSLMIRTGELLRIVKFALVGASGVIVNEGIRKILTTVYGMNSDVWAAPVGIEISIITNFLLNNFITFKDRKATEASSLGKKLIRYNIFSIVGALIQFGVYMLLTRVAGMNTAPWDTVANLIGIVIAMFWNFFSNSWWTWKE